jgi:hypothetical protein
MIVTKFTRERERERETVRVRKREVENAIDSRTEREG